jgi:type I restriction-modification system DNA methylase subunit
VYQSAIGSTLNAHYTGAEIIRGVYQMLSRMGFSGGKILEPSMGTGHFFRSNAGKYGTEIDLDRSGT